MNPRWVIFRREFGSIFSEKTILLAVVIQVFVAGFSSFLVVGLASLVDPAALPSQAQLEVGVAGIDDPLTRRLLTTGVDLTHYDDNEQAMDAFREGKVDALILTEPVPTEDGDAIILRLVLPEGDLRSTLGMVQLKQALENYEMDLRTERADRLANDPVYVQTDGTAGSYSFVYSLLIPLLIFLPVVLAGALAADSITEEVQRGTFPLLLASPATAAEIIEGKIIANTMLAPLLGIAWIGLLAMNGITIPLASIPWILTLATAGALGLTLLACIIALATRDRNKAHILYALALFAILGTSLTLPITPVNAVALLSAGSANTAVHATVLAITTAALLTTLLTHLVLHKSGARLLASEKSTSKSAPGERG